MNMDAKKIRAIALYLPQFHPTPENDRFWGEGYTEWVSVAGAKPLFPGHRQPRIPKDLGFYDLRLPESRIAQADLARKYGVEGFCYWHYWFGNGKRMLERPFNEVLASGQPDFPFCLAWANHHWYKKLWGKDHVDGQIMVEQTYPGEEDYVRHFYEVLPAFKDHRYITVEGKPLFVVFVPFVTEEMQKFLSVWRELAVKEGLKGIYFVLQYKNDSDKALHDSYIDLGFDGVNPCNLLHVHSSQSRLVRGIRKAGQKYLGIPRVYSYKSAIKDYLNEDVVRENIFPTVFPNWDHSPRSDRNGIIIKNSTPELFKAHCKEVFSAIAHKPYDKRIVFIKSWNEWGEGNYIEPDQEFGCGFLQALKEAIDEFEEKA